MLTLLKQLFAIEADFAFDAEKQRTGLTQLIHSSLDAEPRAAVFVATQNEKVVAMCSCQLVTSTAEGGTSGLVEDVIVDQAFRTQGIGQQLMQHVEQWARARGLKRLQLLADTNNTPALGFYTKQGWQSTRLTALIKKL